MTGYRQRSIAAAIAAALCAVSAGAVSVNPAGVGDVLIYPYYTSRAGFVSSFTVVNTNTFHTTVARVRLREGRAGAPVLDFNVWLAPRDVWTASIVDNGSGAALYSPDNSCTLPQLPSTPAAALPFTNGSYVGTQDDNGGSSLDRTREGYIEVIAMGVAANQVDLASSPSSPMGIVLAAAVKPSPTGVPPACALIDVPTLFGVADVRPPAGGLTGNAIIIGASTGTEFAYTPTALQRFFRPAAPANLYTAPGNPLPDLSSVSPAASEVYSGDTPGSSGIASVPDWVAAGGQPIDAVSAVLMHSAIFNEFDISTGIKTDIVVTQPTKRFYVAPGAALLQHLQPQPAIGPYTDTFASGTPDSARSCDPTFDDFYDREAAPYSSLMFQGGPPGPGPALVHPHLCWSASVLTVTPPGSTDTVANSVFTSANADAVRIPTSAGSSSGFSRGWVGIWPTRTLADPASYGPGQIVAFGQASPVFVTNDPKGGLRNLVANGNRYRGLPMIGFAAVQASAFGQGYGGIFPSRYATSVAP